MLQDVGVEPWTCRHTLWACSHVLVGLSESGGGQRGGDRGDSGGRCHEQTGRHGLRLGPCLRQRSHGLTWLAWSEAHRSLGQVMFRTYLGSGKAKSRAGSAACLARSEASTLEVGEVWPTRKGPLNDVLCSWRTYSWTRGREDQHFPVRLWFGAA